MKHIAILLLLAGLNFALMLPAKAQSTGAAEYGRQSQVAAKKSAKQQRKIVKKAAKKQRKAMKKYAKAQRKAAKKTHR